MRDRIKQRINAWYFWAGEHPGTVALVALGIGVVSTVFAVTAVVQVREQGDRITKIERKSACEEDADSYACQHTKQESARAASIYTTCIPFKKVGYLCPRPGSGISIKPSERGHGALEPPSSPPASSPGAPRDTESSTKPPTAGSYHPPAAESPVATQPPEPPTSTPAPETSAPTSPEPEEDTPASPPPSTHGLLAPVEPVLECEVTLLGIRVCS